MGKRREMVCLRGLQQRKMEGGNKTKRERGSSKVKGRLAEEMGHCRGNGSLELRIIRVLFVPERLQI
ncbi:hypothetical protein L6452_13606 [Arctium lappa]|uniref:Uncharacterized protein n=1 Tax=Arctium lappa TaxID=4217 RepID=A0ACB9CIR5_ARCLA|nr:hypothetical protein L6452_13606 [Arctium lappa]